MIDPNTRPSPIVQRLMAMLCLLPAALSSAAFAQGGDMHLPKTPAPGEIGPALPVAMAQDVQELSRPDASRFAMYMSQQVMSAIPGVLLRGGPNMQGVQALADPAGPLALFVPARDLAESAIASPPVDGLPLGWLFLRYATVIADRGEVPDDRLPHVIIPGPARLTVLPLFAVQEEGKTVLGLFGKDGALLGTVPLLPMDGVRDTGFSLSPREANAATRDIVIHVPGYTGTLHVGSTPEADRLPRPLMGNLKVGDPAPDFALKTVKGEARFRLSDARGRQPVVLIFGSFT